MKEQSQAEIVGLFKYGVIAGLFTITKGTGKLKKEIMALSKKSWINPQGQPIKIAPKTIEEWFYTFRKFGFQGLLPKQRKDTGLHRALGYALQEEITRRKKANPKLTTSKLNAKLPRKRKEK